jgi:photosystem II stability/assembly factor-like uncharacterized protein
MMPLSRRTVLSAALVVLWCALAGCTEERTRMDLEAMPLPEGGAVASVAVVEQTREPDDDDAEPTTSTTLVAPTPSGLFIQTDGAEGWTKLTPEWPESVVDTNAKPIAALVQEARRATFPASQRLVGQNGRLWLLWRPQGDARPKLFVSPDAGRTWQLAALPTPAAPRPTDGDNESESSSADDEQPESPKTVPQSANTTFRLLDHDELGLFLVMPREVWRAPTAADGPVEAEDWERIDLSGIDFSADSQPNELPSVVRNYAPPSASRPFEVVTVLGDQLRVYRRMKDASQWLMVSTLPTADRQLVDIPGSEHLLLVSPTQLYRSRDFAERWDPLQMPPSPDEREFSSAIATASDEGTVLLTATRSGEVYRSADLGSSWTSAHDADPDLRAITHLVDAPNRGAVFAATRGNGVLRSMAAGSNWHIFNTGLRASRPMSLHVRSDGTLLVGTNSGLFEAAPSEIGSRWTRLHDRSTTALHVDPDTATTYSGTFGGAVVVRGADGKNATTQTAPFDQTESVLVRPGRLRGIALLPNSIVSISARPDTQQVFAWSHRQGPLESRDGGNSWASMPLNEAFLSAMDESYISNFMVADQRTLYMLNHSVRGPEIAQIWRSRDDGETWTSIRRLADPQRALPIHLLRSTDGEDALFLSHRSRLLRSLDAGTTWRAVPGPWERSRFIAHSLRDRVHAMILETEHVTEFAVASDVAVGEPTVRRLTIDWPNAFEGRRENLRSMDFRGSRAYIATQNQLFLGTIPTSDQQMPDGVAVIITITAVFILIGVGFLFLRLAFRE